MRIIAGKYKGRRLISPETRAIRPTGDKVKEALFAILMFDVEGASFVDLFAGTGSIGLEALSRGANSCLFCDSNRDSIRLIQRNVDLCGAGERARLVWGEYGKALRSLDKQADIFFLDPPFGSDMYEGAIQAIRSLDLLAPDGIIIAEYDTRKRLAASFGSLKEYKKKVYGKTSLSFYTYADSYRLAQ